MTEVVKGIFQDGNKYLFVKRSSTIKSFPGLWDFPGGKLDPGETPPEALVREIKEETAFDVSSGSKIKTATYKTSDWDLVFHYFKPEILGGRLKLSFEHSEFSWMTKKDVNQLELHPAIPVFFE